ncbi:4'-phosphopantetheinyl transferase family protein [Jidongwangia harbinensis]|uniref:4'-phosphopantetheinyl transferase family protein n=1 Tax=Jidongwangia harbinensis TaxID=2878561 RepID=UPI001CD94E51|nr:4'-phosphopantetheinyl transferase superfamily protein [Jidongwangia harbinensis]MCA2215916.1 4'-phosphopantetheinyl transferase superfamily protein [Jidongwangia harbinensis]
MIESILPAGVRAVETRTDPADPTLFPEEAELVARAVPRRRAEFATVRHLARRGLAELGHPPVPILRGHRGAPVWPDGVVGSMTHCQGYRAVAVAPAGVVGGLGIDAEVHEPLPDGVSRLVASDAERDHLDDLAGREPAVHWDRLLFCAKECMYKVWSPRTGEWLGFLDAAVSFTPDDARFTVRLLVPGPWTEVSGRFRVEDGIVVAAIAV